jgi:tetratricopeptide (TPR) repeat protein
LRRRGEVTQIRYLAFNLLVALAVAVVPLEGCSAWPFGAFKEVRGVEGAIAEFQKAIRLEPDNDEAYEYLSLAYRLDGRLEEAIEVYEEAAEVNPRHAWPYLGLGDIYMDEGDVEKAATAYQQAIALEPYLEYGYERLGRAYEAQGDVEAALVQYLGAADIALGPETGMKPYLGEAEKHISEGDLKAAENAIETAHAVMPYDPYLLSLAIGLDLALMERYQAQGQMSSARVKAWEVLAIDPKQKLALEILTWYDFIDNLDQARIDAPQEPFEHFQVASFTMPATGDKRQVLLMHPEARASYQLRVPSGPSVLRFSLAMSPETWDWGGDGATFEIYLDGGSGEEILFSKHISNDAKDRRWHDEEIDLSLYAGREIDLTFVTGPGPGVDFTGDAAGWATPRIMLK